MLITPSMKWVSRKMDQENHNQIHDNKVMYLDWESIHPDGISGILENSPLIPSDHSLSCDTFISIILMNNDNHWIPTTTLLKKMLKEYPEYVWVEKDYFGNYELCFKRAAFKRIIGEPSKFSPSGIVIESFERGLKHAGLEVVSSTHRGIEVKRWRIKKREKEKEREPVKIKKREREREREETDLDNSEEGIKLEIETICKCPPKI